MHHTAWAFETNYNTVTSCFSLAAAQLVRLRDAGFHLTICVDKVAASGGYMMACIANEIIAAPFAIVGSIGAN
jgi:serine protease SohB